MSTKYKYHDPEGTYFISNAREVLYGVFTKGLSKINMTITTMQITLIKPKITIIAFQERRVKFLLIGLLCLGSSFTVTAQTSYQLLRKPDTGTRWLIQGSDTITIQPYKKTGKGAYQKRIETADKTYILDFRKKKNSTLRTTAWRPLLTISKERKTFDQVDIKGDLYPWVKPEERNTWSFGEVLTVQLYREDGKKMIKVTEMDGEDEHMHLLRLMALNNVVEIVQTRAKNGITIGLTAAAGILAGVAASMPPAIETVQ